MLLPTRPQCAHRGRGRQKTPHCLKPHLCLGPIAQRDPLKLLFICPITPPFSPLPVPHVYDSAPLSPTLYPHSSAPHPQGPVTPQLRSGGLAGLCHPAAALPTPNSFSSRVASIQFKNSASVSAFWCCLKTIGSLRTLRIGSLSNPLVTLCVQQSMDLYMCVYREIQLRCGV